MSTQTGLSFVFYFACDIEKAWDVFVSAEANRVIFMGADFHIDLKPGGIIRWTGPGPEGKVITYVGGLVVTVEAPSLLEYTFQLGDSEKSSRVTMKLTQEREATKVEVLHDGFGDDATTRAFCADGWPRILSRSKTLVETGKTFNPH